MKVWVSKFDVPDLYRIRRLLDGSAFGSSVGFGISMSVLFARGPGTVSWRVLIGVLALILLALSLVLHGVRGEVRRLLAFQEYLVGQIQEDVSAASSEPVTPGENRTWN